MNWMIVQGLWIRLDEARGRWVEDLPSKLWAYHTMPRALTIDAPFNLVFDIEVVIPIEISLPTLWTEHFDESNNLRCLLLNLDQLNETRDKAFFRMVAYRQWVAQYYNS